mgnify:CR=1 FL=1
MIAASLLRRLRCPLDHTPLTVSGDRLLCEHQHRYPVVDGVPVMLVPGQRPTIDLADHSLARAEGLRVDARAPELHLESLGISEPEKEGVVALAKQGGAIDPVVAYLVAATNGLMYRHLIGSLASYPIPDLPLPEGNGRSLLDIGCSWGRWTIAAERRGYHAVGVDPSLGAVMAARRVALSLGVDASYVVADARQLPFDTGAFDTVYSYSVIQHFSRDDANRAVAEVGRVLRLGGVAKIQMPTRFGVRCLMHQARRSFRDGEGFEVRYWSLPALRHLFERAIGTVRISVDGFFGIGLQRSDAALMTPALRRVLWASEWLKRASRWCSPLTWVADSVFVEAARTR